MGTAAWVVIDAAGDATITMRFDPDVIAALKKAIPSAGRRWDPSTRTWQVTARFTHLATSTLTGQLGDEAVEIIDNRPRRDPPPAGNKHWAQDFFSQLPERLVEPAYKSLTKVLHPDVGGDGRLQQELNDTYQDLRRRGSHRR